MTRMSSRVRVLPVVLAVAVGLTACQPSGGPVTRSSSAASSSAGGPAESAGSTRQLDQARKDAGIPDCTPAAGAGAVSGGLPAIDLECLGGGSAVAMGSLRGPLVINLWAQWCGPCREEAPVLAAVSREAAAKNSEAKDASVDFLGVIYSDPRPDLAIEFAKDAGWRYPQVVDQDHRLQEAGLRVAGQPTTLFVDASGRIVANHPGPFASEQQLRDAISDHLGVRVG